MTAAALRRLFIRRNLTRIYCGLCRGTGRLWSRHGSPVDCPECRGAGELLVMRQRLRFVAEAAAMAWGLLVLGLLLVMAP